MGGMRGPNNLRLVGFDVWIPEPTGELEPEATSFLEGYLKRRQVQVEEDGSHLSRSGIVTRTCRNVRSWDVLGPGRDLEPPLPVDHLRVDCYCELRVRGYAGSRIP